MNLKQHLLTTGLSEWAPSKRESRLALGMRVVQHIRTNRTRQQFKQRDMRRMYAAFKQH